MWTFAFSDQNLETRLARPALIHIVHDAPCTVHRWARFPCMLAGFISNVTSVLDSSFARRSVAVHIAQEPLILDSLSHLRIAY